jgi:hypothetical protein
LLEGVMKQFNEEVGELNLTGKELMILRMKFGLSAPQLIPIEIYLMKYVDNPEYVYSEGQD